MPNFDGGHYFLTVLIPIKGGTIKCDDGSSKSPEQLLKEALICLPTAEQALGEFEQRHEAGVTPSPFAASHRTHLARFVVINDTVFGGRENENVLVMMATKVNPIIPNRVDKLNTPYLFFSVDFDAASGDKQELCSYLAELWEGGEAQLRSVFQYCFKFDKVNSAKDFCNYIIKCQIETTMPFNDYWSTPPPLSDTNIQKPVIALAAAAIIGLASLAIWLLNAGWGVSTKISEHLGAAGWWGVAGAGAVALVVFWFLFARKGLFKTSPLGLILLFLSALAIVGGIGNGIFTALFEGATVPWGWFGLGLICLAAILVRWLYGRLMKVGRSPFPTAPNSTLPEVLKALYLQHRLTEFVIENQGADPADLHKAFGEFIEATRPDDVSGPTQHPGQLHFSA